MIAYALTDTLHLDLFCLLLTRFPYATVRVAFDFMCLAKSMVARTDSSTESGIFNEIV